MAAAELSDAIGHVFGDAALLRQALTHRSHSQPHNERLEFVGDAVLNCVIALALFQRFPALPEGDLSRLRAGLVNQASLASHGERMALGRHLLLGEGEARSGGATRPSILADALEALIGAVFVDAGFERAQAVTLGIFEQALADLDPVSSEKDPKTRLQEHLQARRLALPVYRVTAVRGEAHRQEFEVECAVEAFGIRASGTGTSRRSAEQVAARAAYERVVAG
jgi:ribonuclease III